MLEMRQHRIIRQVLNNRLLIDFTMASSIPVATVIKSCVKAFFGFEKISKTDPSSISSPFCMTATRLAISLTICISWVIKTMVKPSFLFNSCNRARICLVVFGSKAEVDSSEIKIFGSLAGHAQSLPAAFVHQTIGLGNFLHGQLDQPNPTISPLSHSFVLCLI